jgi:hypothetical protein
MSTLAAIKPDCSRVRAIVLSCILFSLLFTIIPLIHASSESISLPQGIIHFLPVTLMNNQSSDTPSPFQQMVVINSSAYSTYEAGNLQNIEFFYSDGTIIPSWLESGNANNSTSSTYWLKIGDGIPAHSSITIYMGFASISTNLFNSQTTGEAPQLSSPQNGVIGYWKFDDGSGSIAKDSSGNDNSGVLENNPTWTEGKYGGALSFNGINNSVELPQGLITNTIPISISVWFQTTSYGVVIGYQSEEYPNAVNYDPAIYVGTDGQLRGELWTGTVSPITTTFKVNDGDWHHAILVGNTSTQSLYLDGNLIGTLTGTEEDVDMGINYVGLSRWDGWPSTSGTWGFFNGTIDEVQILNTALAPSQACAASLEQAPVSIVAPSVSVGEYDDGANVFNVYANFKNASLPATWQLQGSAKFVLNQGVETVDGNGEEEGAIIYTKSMVNQSIVIEASTSYFGSADCQNIGFYANGTPSGMGGGGAQAPKGYVVSFNPYYGGAGLYQNGISLISSSVFPSSSGYSFQQVAISSERVDYKFASSSSQYYSGVYGQLMTGFTYLAGSSNGNSGQNPNISNSFGGLYFSSSTGGASSTQYIYWLRVRALPPDGIMPSAVIGYSVTFVETGLPSGTTWSITLSNVGTYNSADNTITFMVLSGNYSYAIGTLKNYAFDPSSGYLSVDSSTSIYIGAHFDWFATVSLSQLIVSTLLLICLSLFFIGVSIRQKRKQNTP